jgi:hypothetical protein
MSTTWSLNVGASSSSTSVRDLAFTGIISDYERLYLAGRSSSNYNLIASVDTSGGTDIETF